MNKIQALGILLPFVAGMLTGDAPGATEAWLLPVEIAESPTTPVVEPAPQDADDPDRNQVVAGGEVETFDLVDALESALADKLGLPGRVELVPTGRLPVLTVNGESIDVVILEHPQRLSGPGVVLRFEVLRAGETTGEWRGVFRCRHLAEVWVPTRRLDPGEAMLPSDFEAREIDLVRHSKSVVAEREHFFRYQLARAVYPGRPISWSDLTPRSLVRKGELVDVVIRDGFLSISMKALAINTGSLGDVVAVRNLESKREFPAEVIDEKTVQVSL